jgi:hypothetical protein
VDLIESVDEVFAVDDETELLAASLPETPEVRRRARVALHVCLERATSARQLVGDLDALAVWLCSHGDFRTGSVLLAMSDRVRDEEAF